MPDQTNMASLSERTLAYIVELDIVGMANTIALWHGASASEHGSVPIRTYRFTRRTPDEAGPLANDPLGEQRGPTVFTIERRERGNETIIQVEEDGIMRFRAVRVPYHERTAGPVVTSGGQRYRVERCDNGCWHGSLQSEYAALGRGYT